MENREFVARGSAAVLPLSCSCVAWALRTGSKSARSWPGSVRKLGRLPQSPQDARERGVKHFAGHDEKNADTARHQIADQQAGGASRAHAASTVSSAGSIAAADPMTEAARTDFSMTMHMVVAVYEHRVV